MLIDALSERMEPGFWKTSRGRSGPLEITLVGHSMGAMVLSSILRSYPKLSVERIVYMAAACSLADFESDVLVYLTNHNETRFWSFSLSDLDETREKGAFDAYERGSLLVWIDNLFEPVLTPMHRRLGKFSNYRDHYELPAKFQKRNHVCVVQFPGSDPDPRTHGEFNDPDKFERVLSMVDKRECPPKL